MSKAKRKDNTPTLIKCLEERGYRVKRDVKYIKKTFNIDPDKLAVANRLREVLGISIQDMFAEALELWIKAKRT